MSGPARVVLLGASHHATPLEIREKLAVGTTRMAEFYRGLRALPGLNEGVLLSTCNRLELYGVVSGSAGEGPLDEFICGFQRFPLGEFTQHRFQFHDRDAVQHLLEVASGIDSQIVGETEIFGQVKAAYAAATEHGIAGPVLNRVFQKAFQAAKFIRSATPIGLGQVSVSSVAVDLAGKIFGDLSGARVLVIGTGEIGEKTMKAFHSRGASAITVLSRTPARAEALAATVGARAGSLDNIGAHLVEHDIVIGCTSAPQPVVGAAVIHAAQRHRRLRPLFLIDLAMPRNFEATAAGLDSVFLYDLEDLVRITDENVSSRRAAMTRGRQIAQEKAERIWSGVEPRLPARSATIAADALAPREQAT